MAAGAPSSCRPPWLEMTTPSAPYSIASSTSSFVVTDYVGLDLETLGDGWGYSVDLLPLSQIGRVVLARSQGMNSRHSMLESVVMLARRYVELKMI